MPLAVGSIITTSISRDAYVVLGTDTRAGLVGAFRALTAGRTPTQIIVTNLDVDVNFTVFNLVFTAPPAFAPAVGARVRVSASPVAFFGGAPVASFPITEESARGILWFYATIPVFGPTVYGLIVEPDGNVFVAQIDEISPA